MKIAHRIITPLFAIGAIAMGFFLKMFYFKLGGLTEDVDTILLLVEYLAPQLNFDLSFEFEYSAFELIQLLMGSGTDAGATTDVTQTATNFMAVIEPISTQLTVFLVFLVLSLVVLLAIAVISALGKRKATIIASCVGLVFLFVSIVASRLAFDKIIGGTEISLSELVPVFSTSEFSSLIQIAAAFVVVDAATLSAGFFALFGMFLLIVFWTIISNMIIKTPIHVQKKHRRKMTIKRPSAYFKK